MNKHLLVLGTRNPKKRSEIEALLRIDGLKLATLADFPAAPDVEETGATFMENAELKATTLARTLGHWTLGEDSGLCVDALGGRPGIYSARFAGEPCSDERNNDKLLQLLADTPVEQRTAHYVCTAAVADSQGTIVARAEGKCHGVILRQRHGAGGFGYDPLFFVPEAKRTFGELPAEYKNAHSHRAAALALLRPQLVALLAVE